MESPKEMVRKGYDKLSDNYRKHYSLSHNKEYKKWINDFLAVIPKDEPILELGSGDGIPVAHGQYSS